MKKIFIRIVVLNGLVIVKITIGKKAQFRVWQTGWLIDFFLIRFSRK